MRAYKRKPRSKLADVVQRHSTGHPAAPTASILAAVQPEIARVSLLRMQHGFQGLLRNRELLSLQYGKAVAKGQTDRAARLARKLADTTAKAQQVADDMAARMPVPERDTSGKLVHSKPRARGSNSTTRNTKLHSKVRHLSPTLANATVN